MNIFLMYGVQHHVILLVNRTVTIVTASVPGKSAIDWFPSYVLHHSVTSIRFPTQPESLASIQQNYDDEQH